MNRNKFRGGKRAQHQQQQRGGSNTSKRDSYDSKNSGPTVPFHLLQERESDDSFMDRVNAVPKRANLIHDRKEQRKNKRGEKKKRKQQHQKNLAKTRARQKMDKARQKQQTSSTASSSDNDSAALKKRIAMLEAENQKLKQVFYLLLFLISQLSLTMQNNDIIS
jgi:hypothetical protein